MNISHKTTKILTLLLLAISLVISSCSKAENFTAKNLMVLDPLMIQPTLFSDLGEGFTVPDALAINANGELFMSVPNYLSWEEDGSKIIKFDGNKPVDWCTILPLHPVTGQVHPMGIEFGPDGNLYVADNQFFSDTNYMSRLLRVNVINGEAVSVDVVVEGFKLANAVRWKGNDIYVSDTHMNLADMPNQSCIFKISLDEMNAGTVKLATEGKDPRKIIQFNAKPTPGVQDTDGADGVCFDNEGNLYCGNFGDGVISKITFNNDGSVKSQTIIIDDPSVLCCDGIYFDKTTEKIYITNSKQNSIHLYDVKDHTLQTLWINGDDNGATGLLDQPCEPLIKDGKLYVVNFDMTFPGLTNTENDQYNTVSLFDISSIK